MRYTYLRATSETLMTQMRSCHSEKRTMFFTHKNPYDTEDVKTALL